MTIALTSGDFRLLKSAIEQMLSPYAFNSERAWLLGVTDTLKRLLHADKGSVRVIKNNRMGVISEDIDDRALSEFGEYYYKFDAGRAVAGSVSRLPRVWTIEESYSDRLNEFYRSEYYNDFHVPWQTLHGLCVSHKRNPGPLDGVMYFHKEGRSAPPFDDRAKALLQLFSPALRAGFRYGYAVAQSAQVTGCIDFLKDGCALVTRSGKVLHHNPALTKMAENTATSATISTIISSTVNSMRLLETSGRDAPSAPEYVQIGRMRYAVACCCIGYFLGIPEPIFMVTLAQANSGSIHGWILANQSRFALSAREREVATLVGARKTNREVAAQLGISTHTARHHTERVLRKLGLERRSAMADENARVNSAPPDVGY